MPTDTLVRAAHPAEKLTSTDAPEDWSELVEQIADLEELLNETAGSGDHDAIVGLDELRELVAERRLRLRNIDVG